MQLLIGTSISLYAPPIGTYNTHLSTLQCLELNEERVLKKDAYSRLGTLFSERVETGPSSSSQNDRCNCACITLLHLQIS